MHDIRLIRDDPEAFDAGLARRGLSPMASDLLALDEKRRTVITELQAGQTRRNEASKAIGAAKAAKDEATASALMAEVATLKTRLPVLEEEERVVEAALNSALAAIPNLPLDNVPQGIDEGGNQLIHVRGTPPVFTFQVKEHDAIGPALGMDFETGVALSGARFTLLRGAMAKLNRALGQFMLDTMTDVHGYEEIVPPILVRDEAMFGTGQLPKFAEDLFSTSLKPDIIDFVQERLGLGVSIPDDDPEARETMQAFLEYLTRNIASKTERRWLIPTAEVSLTNIVRESILAEEELPRRFTALTPCFRSEAGAAGRDTRGLIRQHQFEKVEMVSITTPDQSEDEHERMTACAEDILIKLGLAFRRMKLCTGDMGFSAACTYDLEVWLPGQDRYREISSCSTCTDFQARRMNARYRAADTSVIGGVLPGKTASKTRFVHTLNGSGLAVGRTLVAVVENYQQADGSVAIPDVLQPYLKGLNRLEPAA